MNAPKGPPKVPTLSDLPTTKFAAPVAVDRDALDGPTMDMRREPPTVRSVPLDPSDVFRELAPTGEDDQPTAVDRTGLRTVVQHVARLARLRAQLVEAAALLDAAAAPDGPARAQSVRDAIAVIDALVSAAEA